MRSPCQPPVPAACEMRVHAVSFNRRRRGVAIQEILKDGKADVVAKMRRKIRIGRQERSRGVTTLTHNRCNGWPPRRQARYVASQAERVTRSHDRWKRKVGRSPRHDRVGKYNTLLGKRIEKWRGWPGIA